MALVTEGMHPQCRREDGKEGAAEGEMVPRKKKKVERIGRTDRRRWYGGRMCYTSAQRVMSRPEKDDVRLQNDKAREEESQ